MKILTIFILMIGCLQTFAGGFEKANIWSGKYTDIASIAASSVDYSEALFFNLAGLAGKEGQETTINFASTVSKFAAPHTGTRFFEGEKTFPPLFGAFYKFAPTKNWE